jgi:hypothetical protein
MGETGAAGIAASAIELSIHREYDLRHRKQEEKYPQIPVGFGHVHMQTSSHLQQM